MIGLHSELLKNLFALDRLAIMWSTLTSISLARLTLKSGTTHLNVRNLQHGFAEVLALKHPNKSFWAVVNTICDTLLRLKASIVEPLGNILIAFFPVNWTHFERTGSQLYWSAFRAFCNNLLFLSPTIKPLKVILFATTCIKFLMGYFSPSDLLYSDTIPQATIRPKLFCPTN